MADPVLKRFEDINVPGKRTPANRTTKKVDPEEEPWDAHPITYNHGGEQKEFFYISALAAALQRSVVTLRSWEKKGQLPRSPYRTPKPRNETIPGARRKGRRLYTRKQIEVVLDAAKREGLLKRDPKGNFPPPTQRFTELVHQGFMKEFDGR